MTRRLVIIQNVSLDGVVALDAESPAESPHPADLGQAEPTAPAHQEPDDVLEVVREHMAAEVGLLLGRRTFEDFRGYWPHQHDDTTGITAHLDAVAKYVVSSTVTEPGWANSTVLRGGAALADEVRALLAEGPDGEVGVTGSVSLCHDLLRLGLVDEIRLFVEPVVHGRGRRLWPHGLRLSGLVPADSRRFRSGVELHCYRLTRA